MLLCSSLKFDTGAGIRCGWLLPAWCGASDAGDLLPDWCGASDAGGYCLLGEGHQMRVIFA